MSDISLTNKTLVFSYFRMYMLLDNISITTLKSMRLKRLLKLIIKQSGDCRNTGFCHLSSCSHYSKCIGFGLTEEYKQKQLLIAKQMLLEQYTIPDILESE